MTKLPKFNCTSEAFKSKKVLDFFSYNSPCKKYHYVIYKMEDDTYYEHKLKIQGRRIFFKDVSHATYIRHREAYFDTFYMDFHLNWLRDDYDERDYDLPSAEYDHYNEI